MMPEATTRVGSKPAGLRNAALILVLAVLSGCNGPLFMLPGGRLSGPEAPLTAAVIPDEGGVAVLETRPDDPYSVNVGIAVVDGVIHIDPAAERRWYQHLLDDPDVRIRFEGDPVVYTARVEPVRDPGVLERFEQTRNVLKLVPRATPSNS
ncbi:MAG: hypothetical protein RIC56_13810 [Pseudomonadales bacterium]